MKLTPITALAALVLIGVGGFMAGRVSSPAPAATDPDAPAQTRSSRSSSRDSSSDPVDTKRLARPSKSEISERGVTAADRVTRMESIVRGENPLDRNRALLAFIDKLQPDDFEEAVAEFPQSRHHRQPDGGIFPAADRLGPGGSR